MSPGQQAKRIGLCAFQKRIAEQTGDEGGKEKKKDEQDIEIVGKRRIISQFRIGQPFVENPQDCRYFPGSGRSTP